jgi:hypothetical protein
MTLLVDDANQRLKSKIQEGTMRVPPFLVDDTLDPWLLAVVPLVSVVLLLVIGWSGVFH